MTPLELTVLPGEYAVCRLAPSAALPTGPGAADGLLSVTRTAEELSIVCPAKLAPAGARVEGPWRCVRVKGTVDFALTGVLASMASPLADAGLSIFAISTFDTDHVLVKAADMDAALAALRGAGHTVDGV
jgi:uncharacterized protein